MKKQSILAILIAALLALTVFTGCAASSKMAAADTASAPNGYYDSKQEAAAAETPMEAPAEPEEEFAYDTVATTEAGSGAAETPEPDDSVADYTAKIIYTASVSIETTEFDKAVAALESSGAEDRRLRGKLQRDGRHAVQFRRHDLHRQPLGVLHRPHPVRAV